MAERSLGVITPGVAGPTRATVNESDPSVPIWCERYRIAHWSASNAGQGYSGSSNLAPSTGDGVYGVLPAIVGTAPPPVLDSLSTGGRLTQIINMADVYIDADVSTDSFLVTCIQV